MSKQYDDYILEHKKGLRKALGWMMVHLPEVLGDDVNRLRANIYIHDESKYFNEEYDAYDKYFYGGEKTPEVENEFNRAWLHHIHNNPHHWQHWVLINDDPKLGEIVLEMEHVYIIEMICDWWSFSWIKEDLYEIFKWWNEHKDHIKLGVETRKTVIDILDKIKEKLDEMGEE